MTGRDLDHPFLTTPVPVRPRPTFLGRSSMRARTAFFALFGLAGLVLYGGLAMYANDRVATALLGLERAQTLTARSGAVERAHSDLRALERRFLVTRDSQLSPQIRSRLDAVSRDLDDLAAHPDADQLERAISTLREGLVQYDQHLENLASEGLSKGGFAGVIDDRTHALMPRLEQADDPQMIQLLGRINQAGSEAVLTGRAEALEALETTYDQLSARVDASTLGRVGKSAVSDLLEEHRSAMIQLVTIRVGQEAARARFEDIQAYVTPSLNALRQVSDEVLAERFDKAEEARLLATAAIAGGGLLVVLWTLVLGLVLMRSIVRPAQALGDAAAALQGGNRTVGIPALGNEDAIGDIARALEDWIAAMAERDHTAQDLDHTRAKLDQAIERADERDQAALKLSSDLEAAEIKIKEYIQDTEEMEALLNEIAQEQEASTQAAASSSSSATTPSSNIPLPVPLAVPLPVVEDGSVAGASQHLASMSQQASRAISEVERTDDLVKSLNAASAKLDVLGGHIVDLRDQMNLFIFGAQQAKQTTGPDGSVQFVRQLPKRLDMTDADTRGRLEKVRQALISAQHAYAECRQNVGEVSRSAQGLADLVSSDAKEATERLREQSQQLEKMLDDVIGRMEENSGQTNDANQDGPREIQKPDAG